MTTFTEEYFNEELLRFHTMLTDKSFWELPRENRNQALQGLATVYMGLDEKADIATCASLFEAASNEYMRRESYMLFHPRIKIGE